MAQKEIRLKVIADTSQVDSVLKSTIKVTSEATNAIGKIPAFLERQAQLQKEINKFQTEGLEALAKRSESINKVNLALEQNKLNAGLAAGAAKSIQTAYENAINPILDKLAKLRSELSSLANATNLSASSATRDNRTTVRDPNKIVNYGTGKVTDLVEEERKRVEIIRQAELQIRKINEDSARHYTNLLNDKTEKAKLLQQQLTTNLLFQEAEREARIAASEERIQRIREAAAARRKLLADKAAEAERVNAERVRIAAEARDRADLTRQTVRTNVANAYKTETESILAELNRRRDLEHSIRVNGANSARTLELKSAQEQTRIREKLATDLAAIENRLRSGTIDRSRARAERDNTLQQAEANLRLADSVKKVSEEHRNLFVHIGEIIGIYRFYNAVINTVWSSLRAIPNIGIELDSTRASLAATTGTSSIAVGVMKLLKEEAQRTGIEIKALRENFRTFQASTSLAGESLETSFGIFKNINSVITSLHLPTEKAVGIFNALAQIFNKSKVQSEELVKQLGNLIPGAFASFAAANKAQFRNSAELIAEMKKGTVFAHETVERFAEFLANRFTASFAIASDGLNANIGRMRNSFIELAETIYDTSSGALNDIVKNITVFVNYVNKSTTETTGLTVAINGLSFALGTLFFGSLLKSFDKFILSLAAAKVSISSMALAMTGAAIPAATRTAGAIAFLELAVTKLKAALAFLINPYTIIAGLSLLVYKFRELQSDVNDAANDVAERSKDIIKAYEDAQKKLNAEAERKSTKNIVKLEFDVSDDEGVKEVRKQIADANAELQKLANPTNLSKLDLLTSTNALLEEKRRLSLLKEKRQELLELNKIEKERVKIATELLRVEQASQATLSDVSGNRDFVTLRREQRLTSIQYSNPAEFAKQTFLKTNEATFEAAKKTVDEGIARIKLLSENIRQLRENEAKATGEVLTLTEENIRIQTDKLKSVIKNTNAAKAVVRLVEQNAEQAGKRAGEVASGANNSIDKVYSLAQKRLEANLKQLEIASKQTLDNISFTAEEAKNKINLAIAQGKPGDNLRLIQIERDAKVASLQESIRLRKEEIALLEKSSTDQITYTKIVKDNINEAFKNLITIESRNKANAVSPTAALGRAQIEPSTAAASLQIPQRLVDLENKARDITRLNRINKTNFKTLTENETEELRKFAIAHQKELEETAFVYFKSLVDRYKGDIVKAVAAYNAGPNAVDNAVKTAIKSGSSNYLQYLPKETIRHNANFIQESNLTSAETSKNSNIKGEENFLKIRKELADKTKELTDLTNQLSLAEQNYGIDVAQTLTNKGKLEAEIRSEFFKTAGYDDIAALLDLEIEKQAKLNELKSFGANIDTSLLDKLYKRREVEIQLTAIREKSAVATQRFQLVEKQVQSDLLAGTTTQQEAFKKINSVRQETLDILFKELKDTQLKLAADKENLKLQAEILRIKTQIADVTQNSGTGQQLQQEIFSKLSQGTGIDLGALFGSFNEGEKRKQSILADKSNALSESNPNSELNQLILNEHIALEEAKKAITEKYNNQIAANNLNLYSGIAKVGADAFLGLTTAAQKMYGENSKQARLAFTAYKAFKIAEIGIQIAANVLAAFGSGAAIPIAGIVAGPAFAAVAAALGAVQLAAVIAQPLPSAHGGLDNVPKEQTYLLDKGERVISPNQNRDLTNYLKDKSVTSNSNVVQMPQNVRIINAIDSSSLDEYLGSASAERIIKNVIRQTG